MSESSNMLRDLEKFLAFPLYRVRGTWKNSEFLLYREAVGEAPSHERYESSYMLWDLKKLQALLLVWT